MKHDKKPVKDVVKLWPSCKLSHLCMCRSYGKVYLRHKKVPVAILFFKKTFSLKINAKFLSWSNIQKESLLDIQTGAYGHECYYFDGNEWNIEPNLVSDKEEGDTKMIMHSPQASMGGYQNVIVHTPDTAVFLIMFGKPHYQLAYIKWG